MKCVWVLIKKYPNEHIAQKDFNLIRKMFPELAIELTKDIIKCADYLGLAAALNKIENNGVEKDTSEKIASRY